MGLLVLLKTTSMIYPHIPSYDDPLSSLSLSIFSLPPFWKTKERQTEVQCVWVSGVWTDGWID